jgi:hypothetical protein
METLIKAWKIILHFFSFSTHTRERLEPSLVNCFAIETFFYFSVFYFSMKFQSSC